MRQFNGNFSRQAFVPKGKETQMKAHMANLTARTWALLTLPLIAVAYPIVTMVLPAIIRAIVPEVVRTVLHQL